MPENLDLIMTLTGGLAVALVLGYITHLLRLSPIVGYLLAGVLLGPHTPGFVADRHLAEQLAEIGVVLLMFGVGLHFHLRELLAVRRIAVPGAIVQSLVATVLGALLGRLMGWSWSAGIVFGLAISVASTVVLTRVLTDNRDLHTRAGHIAIGWLVVEDLFTVLVLVLLPVLFSAKEVKVAEISVALLLALVKLGVLISFTIFVGGKVIPWLLERIASTRSRELFTLSILVVALGIAVGSAKLFGVSMALGAFLGGMVVGRSDFSLRAAADALPMKDAFAVLFFVSIGMLFDPTRMFESPVLVAATVAIILIGKPLAAIGIALLLRYPLGIAISVGAALAQIGEFSFIMGTIAKNLGILNEAALNTLIASAIISMTVNPFLYGRVAWIESWMLRQPRLRRWVGTGPGIFVDGRAEEAEESSEEARYRAIVVGYGPVGRSLVRMLLENEIEPTVIELNLDTVHRLRDDGIRAIYGDSTHRETIEAAGLKGAVAFVLSSSGMQGSAEAIRLAREVNPTVHVFARAGYLKEIPALRLAGADVVFSSEGEVALSMTEFMLRHLGATEEQIDDQRQRMREELFGTPLAMEILLPLPGRKSDETPNMADEPHPFAAPAPEGSQDPKPAAGPAEDSEPG
ncbi:MAG: cation:proton antiporter [Pirellulaceae bacterium]|nr:cation:proton antiporter [Pirellulaceae bacterium]